MNKKKITQGFKEHLSDSTAIITFFNPIYATLETFGAGMTDEISLQSRMLNALVTYGGLGSLTKIRDLSMRACGISKESRNVTKYLHDTLFTGICVLAIRPLIYIGAGETDLEKMAIGTGGSIGLGALLGGPALYFIDCYRDLTEVRESERIPPAIQRQRPSFKKRVAAGLAAASIAATGLIYYSTPDTLYSQPHAHQSEAISQRKTVSAEDAVLESTR